MAETETGWNEAASQLYQEIAHVAVPARAEQIATLLTLIPFAPDASFRVLEIGCGEGLLSATLLQCFPQATVVALDGSAAMRQIARKRLASFGVRASVKSFDLFRPDWLNKLTNVDVVLSSLCLHHLPGPDKRRLFTMIADKLSRQGALLIADLIEPQRRESAALFAATWDRITEAQAVAQTGSSRLYTKFVDSEWNYYRFADPDDRPSGLFEQLLWLVEAGLVNVDCFWLQAGHAIYGGYKTDDAPNQVLDFTFALETAQAVGAG